MIRVLFQVETEDHFRSATIACEAATEEGKHWTPANAGDMTKEYPVAQLFLAARHMYDWCAHGKIPPYVEIYEGSN